MKIKFVPQNIEIEGDSNKSLLQICQENQIHINSICKGVPKCAECRIKITSGDGNVLPPSSAEISILGNNYYLDGRRLSCQVRAFGDITVDTSEQVVRDQSHKKIRGFQNKDKGQTTNAVLDTMVLSKPETKS